MINSSVKRGYGTAGSRFPHEIGAARTTRWSTMPTKTLSRKDKTAK